MLYAVMGALLEKAAATLRSGAVRAGGDHAGVQLRRVSAFVARAGRMWSGHVEALHRQNAVLAAALAEAGGDAAAGTGGEPLSEHVRLLSELDRMVEALHRHGDVATRRTLRRRLAEAARIEMALVEG